MGNTKYTEYKLNIFLTIGKVVVIRFHCLYICIHSKITKIFDKKKRFSFFSRQKKKKILKPTEKLMLSSQKRQVFITYNTYVSVCLHQQFQTLKHTKVFCDNQDLFNVCLKKKSLFIKFYMSSWSVISAIIYHQTSFLLLLKF